MKPRDRGPRRRCGSFSDPGGRSGSAVVETGAGGMRATSGSPAESIAAMAANTRSMPTLESALPLKERDHAHEPQGRGLPEVNLALDERLERREALGLVEAARLDVLEDHPDVVERLPEVLAEPLDLRKGAVKVSHLLLDVLGVLRRPDGGPGASRQGRLSRAGAGLGGVFGRMASGPGGSAAQAELALQGSFVLRRHAALRGCGLGGRRWFHRRFRHRSSLLRLGHVTLDSVQSPKILELRARAPPDIASTRPGGDSGGTLRANYQSREPCVYSGNASRRVMFGRARRAILRDPPPWRS